MRVCDGWRYLYPRSTAPAARLTSCSAPRVVVTDRLANYRTVLAGLKCDGLLPEAAQHLRGRCLNNRVEQDRRRVERRTQPMLRFKRFTTARRALAGIEAMTMLAKEQARNVRSARRSATSSTGSSVSPPASRCGRGVPLPDQS